MMNAVQVTAQMVANFSASLVMSLTGSIGIGMAVGGIYGLIGMLFVFPLILPKRAAVYTEDGDDEILEKGEASASDPLIPANKKEA